MNVPLNKEESEFLLNILRSFECNAGNSKEEKTADKLIKRIERARTPIKPRSAKNKGLEWQKEVCGIIAELIGEEFDQSKDDCNIHSRESGLSGTDVILRGAAKEKFPFSVECKNCKSLSIPMWISQAESNCDNEDNWILFVKSPVIPGKKIVTLSLNQFTKLFKNTIK